MTGFLIYGLTGIAFYFVAPFGAGFFNTLSFVRKMIRTTSAVVPYVYYELLNEAINLRVLFDTLKLIALICKKSQYQLSPRHT